MIKATGARSLILVLSLGILAAVGLFTMYATEAGPFNDPTEPVACQDLSRYRDLPAGKLDVIRQECEEAKAALESASPGPPITPVPGTPPPLIPCDQWEPSISPGCVFYGILEGRQPPPGYEKVILVSNQWAGSHVIVYAGSLHDDASQGIVVVIQRERLSLLGEYRTAAKEGALRIVSAEGSVLKLMTATGGQYTFDVDTMALVQQ